MESSLQDESSFLGTGVRVLVLRPQTFRGQVASLYPLLLVVVMATTRCMIKLGVLLSPTTINHMLRGNHIIRLLPHRDRLLDRALLARRQSHPRPNTLQSQYLRISQKRHVWHRWTHTDLPSFKLSSRGMDKHTLRHWHCYK